MRNLRSADDMLCDISRLRWVVPQVIRGERVINYFDWVDVPAGVRSTLMDLGELLLEQKGTDSFFGFAYGVRYLYKFLEANHQRVKPLTALTETEWGAFVEWLCQQPSRRGGLVHLSTVRGYVTGIGLALELAWLNGGLDVTVEDVETVREGVRRRFRDLNLLSAHRAAKRAWTEEERLGLLELLREEWLAWKDWRSTYGLPPYALGIPAPPDLLAVTATYLCWEETVRPEEINVMTVDDLEFGDANRIFLHAPNKREGWIEVDKVSAALLKATVAWGEEARRLLGTNRLFVQPFPKPAILNSTRLGWRLRDLLRGYAEKYPINRPDVLLSDGRKTLGSILAGQTADDELVQETMRHAQGGTMRVYYIRQGKVQLSRNIRKALRHYATRLSMTYNRAVINPEIEAPPDVAQVLKRNPNHNTPYGACWHDSQAEGPCNRGIHCGECEKLIPMASKIGNYEAERDLYTKMAEEARDAGDLTTYQNRMNFAGLMEGHVLNIRRRMEEADLSA